MRVRTRDGALEVSMRTTVGQVVGMLRNDRRAARALKRMPKPVPWEWARARLVPLLAGPRIDLPGEQVIRSILEPGVAVEFAIDLRHAFPVVDARVAARWECSEDQLREQALANLARWASQVTRSTVRTATMSGHEIRLLDHEPPWASSLLLVPDELKRLFGAHDQVLAAPARDVLLSFPRTMPTRLVAEIAVDFEAGTPHPLWLEPFGLEGGAIHWSGNEEFDDEGGADSFG